jgi:hypothetical protein
LFFVSLFILFIYSFHRLQLAVVGVPAVLQAIQADERLKRQTFHRAISHIAATVIPALESGITHVSYYSLVTMQMCKRKRKRKEKKKKKRKEKKKKKRKEKEKKKRKMPTIDPAWNDRPSIALYRTSLRLLYPLWNLASRTYPVIKYQKL